MLIEAGSPVPWTKPEDVPFPADGPLPRLGGPDEKPACTVFADGHSGVLPAKPEENWLRRRIDYRNTAPVHDVP